MSTSYKEDCENYKNAKYAPELGEADAPHRKVKPKRKVKRSNHKHLYTKEALLHDPEHHKTYCHVYYCEVCGKIQDWRYLWNAKLEDYPNAKIVDVDSVFEITKYISV